MAPTPSPRPEPPEPPPHRVMIEGVHPEVDGGRFPIKRTVGEAVVVEADVFTDGHDLVAAAVLHRPAGDDRRREVRMTPVGNDRFVATFVTEALGRHHYTVAGWVDAFETWRHDLAKRLAAGQDVATDLLIGSDLVAHAGRRAAGADAKALRAWARQLAAGHVKDPADALDPALASLVGAYPDPTQATVYERELEVVVDPERARFSAWYEMFPRSASNELGRHGTFKDVEARLPYVARMGFDVLYLPPIHPIARTHRKGRNNSAAAKRGDPGSPWAIGAKEGGHTAIHRDLGTMEDFEHLVRTARDDHGIDVAIDVAFQCSPDHPWVTEHPEWFRHRPDGSIQYAENPPKRYQDIFPLDFSTPAWRELWEALVGVFRFWIGHGVRIFRVDNPHTKPFAFWEWALGEIKRDHPEVILLSEAFTRPKVMHRLAKLGFTQSYTYFAWRNAKWELEQYFGRDLPEVREFFRPNLWPNTPDILTEYLQTGGRPAFVARLILAATLGASYGIYGPAFELCENAPREPGSEEYLNSEKYEVKRWDLDREDSLAELIALVNRIRRDNPALHADRGLRVHQTDNDALFAYTKSSDDRSNVILSVVNLDPFHPQSGWVELDPAMLPASEDAYQVHDLLTGARYLWHGPRNFVLLDPHQVPAHVFAIARHAPDDVQPPG
jgi:starch synthase (maltosyl-transferring)